MLSNDNCCAKFFLYLYKTNTYEKETKVFNFINCVLSFLIFVLIIKYFRKCSINFLKNKQKNDELLNQRIKFIKQKQYEYYYTMAINSPERLSDVLADRDVKKIKQKNRVLSLYTKLKYPNKI